jgi:hypothetical protein
MLRESNRFPIAVELMILVVAALTGPKMGEVVDELDRGNPFHLLETELIFTPQSHKDVKTRSTVPSVHGDE